MGGNDGGMLDGLELDEEKFLSLLRKLIGETEHLQNNPPALIPTEDRAVQHVTEVLGPLSVENGGPLILKHVSYVEGRGNLIVEYPGTLDGKVVSFVGSHLDVVTANPNDWVDFGDSLYFKQGHPHECYSSKSGCWSNVWSLCENLRLRFHLNVGSSQRQFSRSHLDLFQVWS